MCKNQKSASPVVQSSEWIHPQQVVNPSFSFSVSILKCEGPGHNQNMPSKVCSNLDESTMREPQYASEDRKNLITSEDGNDSATSEDDIQLHVVSWINQVTAHVTEKVCTS